LKDELESILESKWCYFWVKSNFDVEFEQDFEGRKKYFLQNLQKLSTPYFIPYENKPHLADD